MDIQQALVGSRPFYVNAYRYGPRWHDNTSGAYFGVAHHYRDDAENAALKSAGRMLLYRLRVTPKRQRGLQR